MLYTIFTLYSQDPDTLSSIEDELEGAMAQISWANDNIEKLQEDIVTFEDMKVGCTAPSLAVLLSFCSLKVILLKRLPLYKHALHVKQNTSLST